MSSTSQYLSVASGHIDSLINYVVDVKPYHVKLSEVVEQYLFEENVAVKVRDDKQILAFLGGDIANNTLVGTHRRVRSNSWLKYVTSDGYRRVWPVPLTSVNKFFSQNSQEKFVSSNAVQIEGLPSTGVFNPVRWDGPGITDVRKNGIHQQDTIDYFLSHGAFTFDVRTNSQWKETNLRNLPAFGLNPGQLFYNDTITEAGAITNIVGGNYEEWTLTCSSISPVTLSVVGSDSGLIGTVEQQNSFVHPKLSFDFGFIPGDDGSSTSIGDIIVLTPHNKITIAPDAPEETWSIIKTNPIGLTSAPVFASSITRSDNPGLKIHTRSLDQVTESATWTIVFGANGSYTVNKYSGASSYSITANLIDGCSFKNDDIHFTIITTGLGFYPGDSFSFVTNAKADNFLVYGSVSGWQTKNAKLDEWYWNGKVGFKIPSLHYFVDMKNATIVSSASGVDDSWTTVLSNDQILRSVSFSNNVFVTAGDNQIVGASGDGQLWTSDISSLVVDTPTDVMIITGDNGQIAISDDAGSTWVTQNSNTHHDLKASTYIPNFLTAIGPDPLVNCMIVVGNNGTILTSVDGMSWAERTSNTTSNLNSIAWSNNAIIVVGQNGTILRSEDRLTWTPISSPNTNTLRSVIYVSSINCFIAVGDNGAIIRSTDHGQTWVDINSFNDGSLVSVAYGNGKFVAVGPDGWIATSPNGQVWSRYRGKRLNSIAFGNGKFVAVGGETTDLEIFTPLKPVHSIAEPSVYTIKFFSPTKATVSNNIYGYRRGLIVNEPWEDEFVSFQIDSIINQIEYKAGDEITVHIAPKTHFMVPNTYDMAEYDTTYYDTSLAKKTVPLLYNNELFPLYHAHGVVIFKNTSPTDTFIIDKAVKDNIVFRIPSAQSRYPELSALPNGIPLEFRYYDRVVNGLPTSEANFSDLTTYIEAYLCSDPTVKVFTITQPRFEKTNRNASATLTFDPTFFNKYLPFNTQYSLTFLTDQTYGQKLRVKISENVRTFARVRLVFDDIAAISILDSPIEHFDIVGELSFTDMANVSFVEGGSLPYIVGYDEFPYDTIAYDSYSHNGVLTGVIETSPGVFEWTGNEDDWVMPKPTNSPSMYIEDSIDENSAATSFSEGFTVSERIVSNPTQISRLSAYYDNAKYLLEPMIISQPANEYLITHNGMASTPTVLVESVSSSGNPVQVVPNMYPYTQHPGVISLRSFSFVLPPSVTAPFKLTIV